MGSLCSSCCGNRDDDIYETEQNDKTNLLGSPVGEPSYSSNVTQKHPPGSLGDQQEKLNRILQKTANSYIDVPALNSPVDQPVDKAKDYESKIQAALKTKHFNEKSSLLQDTPHLERTLSEEPISDNERNLLQETNASILEALQSMQVENSENLVIPFNNSKNNQ
ncbi:ragulator complex protein LAMTOR1 isoform X2 [Parasteatoda tepidariorum]|uniref:Ragulator complex protein LAMTOR1 n=1 Tax=Parasteatoda tepidariorum TaxID=114398 RepID=A0A2L2Y4F9_PARTP|nr:uncharacterized protein LOC107453543 isoform X1 [Parasteatoda tepidariorum]XP_042902607.1 uncharacterized protein LOC107453543 isoform X2 [Parasteatoda tepidariorum]